MASAGVVGFELLARAHNRDISMAPEPATRMPAEMDGWQELACDVCDAESDVGSDELEMF